MRERDGGQRKSILSPPKKKMALCNIAQVCIYYDVTRPTFSCTYGIIVGNMIILWSL